MLKMILSGEDDTYYVKSAKSAKSIKSTKSAKGGKFHHIIGVVNFFRFFDLRVLFDTYHPLQPKEQVMLQLARKSPVKTNVVYANAVTK